MPHTGVKISEARGAGVGIKPGVERSETPGTRSLKTLKARGAAESGIITGYVRNRTAIGRSAGSDVSLVIDPGVSLRFTPGFMPSSAPRTKNQLALRYRPLRGLKCRRLAAQTQILFQQRVKLPPADEGIVANPEAPGLVDPLFGVIYANARTGCDTAARNCFIFLNPNLVA